MSSVTFVARSRAATLLLALTVLAVACTDGSRPTTTPPSLPDETPTAAGSTPTSAPTRTPTPAAAPWPDGWDIAFCALFEETVVAQELARDIGRAFDEDDRDDAAALAHELDTTVDGARALLATLPDWIEAAEFETQLTAMLDQDERLATYWLRHIEQGRRPALQNARNVAAELRDTYVPAVQSELLALAAQGVSCQDGELTLETP